MTRGAILLVALTTVMASGCNRAPNAEQSQRTRTVPRDTPRSIAYDEGEPIPIFIDPQTGCEYLGYIGHGLTPRMQIDGGNYRQAGCTVN